MTDVDEQMLELPSMTEIRTEERILWFGFYLVTVRLTLFLRSQLD